MRVVLIFLLAGCAGVPEQPWEPPDSGPRPAVHDAGAAEDAGTDAGTDAGPDGGCDVFGVTGECVTTSECAAIGDHTSYAGYCPGTASVECCIKTPSTADDPPIPSGYKLMQQSQVTPEMTQWAVDILHDWAGYPMYSKTLRAFGSLEVLARVEWHLPDFQNSAVHRGVTLYVPI